MKAIDLRVGQGIVIDGKVAVVTSYEHRTPGNLRAFVQLGWKEVATGKSNERRLNPADDIEVADLDRRPMEYLFSDQHGATFMDIETFDQIVVPDDVLGNALLYLTPNTQCIVVMHASNPVMIELPPAVELTVTDTPPGIKGATATNQSKEATCETGLKTKVPPFIVPGEKIKVSTADGSYLSRAKGDD